MLFELGCVLTRYQRPFRLVRKSWYLQEPSRTWSNGMLRSRIATFDLLKIVWRTWNSAACEACAAGLWRDTNTRHYRSSRAVLGRGCRGRWTRSSTEAFENFTHFIADLELGYFFNELYVCVWKISHMPCSPPWKSGHSSH